MSEDRPVGRAAFLGGLLSFVALVACSVVGVGHSRSLEGDANLQYWIVVGLTAATIAGVTFALSRERARTGLGEAARKAGVALAAIGLVLFIWETIAIGFGAESAPVLWLIRAFKG
ncbi:hypothetical protein ACFQI3_09810 [Hansschlegelia quercus]|uniref:Uncharacterized protein n=1 Tax=Hansschlegelia quercus TaxID=2528245 RepID=A0A4Q9GNL1_9HYPH|nr:hypothetical protein [Hansschlegelia quercus]TBN54364.1 hypothetical protein EYR15_05890 [Hansschlegelia quercus]